MIVSSFICSLFGGLWGLKEKALQKSFYLKLYSYVQAVNCSSIAYNSFFKTKPCFPHGVKGIFISGDAKIGDNAIIFQHVTIGSNTLIDSPSFGSPTIGNNCYISAGAKIVGNIIIGDNVRIGANAVVYKDIPSCSVVVGNCRIIKKKSLNNKFYTKQNKFGWVYYNLGSYIKEDCVEILKILNNRK
jgi:serine O-acetyltransferase